MRRGLLLLTGLMLLFISCEPEIVTRDERIYAFIDQANDGDFSGIGRHFSQPELISDAYFLEDDFPRYTDSAWPLTVMEITYPDSQITGQALVRLQKNDSTDDLYYTFQLEVDIPDTLISGEVWYIQSLQIPHDTTTQTIPPPG